MTPSPDLVSEQLVSHHQVRPQVSTLSTECIIRSGSQQMCYRHSKISSGDLGELPALKLDKLELARRASHILGMGMSVTRPLQNSLNDVIRLWSKSRNAVCCSVSLRLLRLTITY